MNFTEPEDEEQRRSPRITHISWGRMEVAGLGIGRDYKLYPGGGREWDWTETGLHHVPGIQPADVQELLAMGAKSSSLLAVWNWRSRLARKRYSCCATEASRIT
jgi:hypothetical protein